MFIPIYIIYTLYGTTYFAKDELHVYTTRIACEQRAKEFKRKMEANTDNPVIVKPFCLMTNDRDI